MRREWNNDQLMKYKSCFREDEQDTILKVVVESELLKEFLDTTEGRLLLGKVMDSIESDLTQIINLAIGDASMTTKKDNIFAAAQRINVAYKFMHNLATMAAKGKEHTENMKQIR